ncbi:MAG: adenylosuccinate synthetase, partial [Candidatus Cloacimonetes bacterium]|nr:adenylosuccinate synthetase [Candidatus Cloacimonadota bacterium]
FFIDKGTSVVLPLHIELDSRTEARTDIKKIGTTKRGIGPCYADRISRIGLQMGDLLDKDYLYSRLRNLYRTHNSEVDVDSICDKLYAAGQKLKPYLVQVPYLLNKLIDEGKNLLFEGAQGSLLDIGFGTYPYVTSSFTTSGGIAVGSGFPLKHVDTIIGIYKSYGTRVGEGAMPTELTGTTGDAIRKRGNEYGRSTGRPRRCGWFDAVAAKYSAMINGLDYIALTLLDVLGTFETLKICTEYEINGQLTSEFPFSAKDLEYAKPQYIELPGWSEDITPIKNFNELPRNAQAYVKAVEEFVGVPVKIISVGADRTETIYR